MSITETGGPETGDTETGDTVAVVVVRDGRLPAGADGAVAEADGAALVVGTGAGAAAEGLTSATSIRWADTPTRPAALAAMLSPLLAGARLVILPASPDGRDLAPHLAAALDRPLLAGAVRATAGEAGVQADLLRADGRVVVPVATAGPAVVTVWPAPATGPAPAVQGGTPRPDPVAVDPGALGDPGSSAGPPAAVETTEVIEPDPATMDLADASRVIAGGAGLVPDGAGDDRARAVFGLLAAVAAALGASAGATRVVTDAGWMGYERQIGTTGVTLHPELYVALGISGASQHTGGIGDPRRVVSVNVDPSCPMTGLSDLGLVADAPAVLVELARRLGVAVPPEIEEVVHP